jgi:hypothetical protein
MNKEYKAPGTDFLTKLELTPPDSSVHGTEEDIRSNLKPLKTWGWKLEGNQLSCQTDMGNLVQTIPTGYICLGDGPDGLPLLRRIDI